MSFREKNHKKSRQVSKKLKYFDEEQENANFTSNSTDADLEVEASYDMPMQSPHKARLVPPNTIYPHNVYMHRSEVDESELGGDEEDNADSAFEPLQEVITHHSPLFDRRNFRHATINTPCEPVASVEVDEEKDRIFLSSKRPVGGITFRSKIESLLPLEWSLRDQNRVKRWSLKTTGLLNHNHVITNVETGAVVLNVKASSVWTQTYEAFLGDSSMKVLWAKLRPSLGLTRGGTIEFPGSDETPLHARANAGGGRIRVYRGEHSAEFYSYLNFDNDKNLMNLVADIELATWSESFKILIQPGQETANMLPLLLFSLLFLIKSV